MTDPHAPGGVETLKMTYAEGDIITLEPSGNVYQRINGNWQLIRRPDGTPVP